MTFSSFSLVKVATGTSSIETGRAKSEAPAGKTRRSTYKFDYGMGFPGLGVGKNEKRDQKIELTRWLPAQLDGEPVIAYLRLPVLFKLTDK